MTGTPSCSRQAADAVHEDLRVLTRVGTAGRRDALASSGRMRAFCTPDILRGHTLIAGYVLGDPSLADLAPDAYLSALHAKTSRRGRTAFLDSSLRAFTSIWPGAALPDPVVEAIRDEVLADPINLYVLAFPSVRARIDDVLDGIDGTGPRAGDWPGPGTPERGAWLPAVSDYLTAADDLALIPAGLLVELVELNPGRAIERAHWSEDATGRVVDALAVAASRWESDDPRWDGVLAEVGELADQEHTPAIVAALLALPSFPHSRIGANRSFGAFVPADEALRGAWPAATILTALAGFALPQDIAGPVATQVAELDARAAALFVALAHDWPGSWDELLRAARLGS